MVPLALTHVAKVAFPDLLENNVLVTPYIAGGPIKSRDLEPGLIRDFATIQNHFNSPEFCKESGTDDGGFYKRFVIRCLETGYRNLLEFRIHNLHIVEQHRTIAAYLLPNQDQLAGEVSDMPFARQHHDFREGSILGENPQVIIDWGSSYGRGPFLYDLAPFLFNHERNLEVFVEHSDICKQVDRKTIDRWLYAATSARFFSFWAYIRELVECEQVEDLEAFLEYHYATYRGLLEREFAQTYLPLPSQGMALRERRQETCESASLAWCGRPEVTR